MLLSARYLRRDLGGQEGLTVHQPDRQGVIQECWRGANCTGGIFAGRDLELQRERLESALKPHAPDLKCTTPYVLLYVEDVYLRCAADRLGLAGTSTNNRVR